MSLVTVLRLLLGLGKVGLAEVAALEAEVLEVAEPSEAVLRGSRVLGGIFLGLGRGPCGG